MGSFLPLDFQDNLKKKMWTIVRIWKLQLKLLITGKTYCTATISATTRLVRIIALAGLALYCTRTTTLNLFNCTHQVLHKKLNEGGFLQSTEYSEYSYPKLFDCETNITVPRSRFRIEIRFEQEFDIERHQDEGCIYDWLLVTGNQYNERRDKLCGKGAPNNGSWIYTNSSEITVNFRSDLTLEGAGYRLEYRIDVVKCLNIPQAPTNGRLTSIVNHDTLPRVGDFLYFQCNKGYRFSIDQNSSSIQCQADGTWSAEPTTCEIVKCLKTPQAPTNGRLTSLINPEKTPRFGDLLNFECNKGYRLSNGQNSSSIQCQADGCWSSGPPTCKFNCTNEVLVKGLNEIGLVTSLDYSNPYPNSSDCKTTIKTTDHERFVVEIRFVENFSIQSDEEKNCVYDWLNITGNRTTRPLLFCGEELPNNGDWIYTNSSEITVHFHSDSTTQGWGYRLEYRIEPAKCFEPPQAPTNSKIDPERDINEPYWTVQQSAVFFCDDGYHPSDGGKRLLIECNKFGSWNSPIATCVADQSNSKEE
ncbi:complement C1r-A subcomponent-like isoform X1 [Clavelina lepadiformis]|uniref:complement C1r-A subcomponent-like isoform X1 n=1 Tax=Clavelina lepadiformis TaxID=159417 RepID=UPI0040416C1D